MRLPGRGEVADDGTAMTYDDRRLAAIYDGDNPAGPDHDYFRAVADSIQATQIVDLGCGTGLLTVTMTGPDRAVTGIDPAQAMLDYAAARPGGSHVVWRLGTSERIEPRSADLVLMTSNVAMHIVGESWAVTLADIASGLRPGGTLAFDTRNPEAHAWRDWSQPTTVRDTAVGRLRESTRTTPPDRTGVVTMFCHNDFLDDGGVVDVEQQLQFRTLSELTADLERAGLTLRHVWGDWHRTPFTGDAAQRMILIEATR